WGESDLPDDLLALILARNANLSDWRRVQRFHGFPKIWGRGFGGTVQAIELGVDKVVVLPGQDAELNVLQAPGDSQGAMALDRVLDDAIHEIARIPQVATGKLESAGNLSGLALEILYGPLIEKTRTKQLLYGQLLAHASRCLLLAGRGQDVPVRVVWPETLPRDDQGAAQTALIWQQLGVSRQTILRRLGFDPAQEAQARAEDEHDLGQEAARAFNAGIGLEP
ncbi:MAG: phage portal protein, partial [Firmicutes bacterium]|nr:phage portal protein [Bacillota bacterium]